MRSTIFLLAGAFAMVLAACSKMDDNYKKYIVPGGLVYPGKPEFPKFYTGNYRAMIVWKRGTDPKISKARIYWNNFTDSVEIKIAPKQDSVGHVFSGLTESIYTYTIRTFDDADNRSVPVELTGKVFGDRYQASLLNRAISGAAIDGGNRATIFWGSADTTNGAWATEVRYTHTNGQVVTARFPAKKDTSYVENMQSGKGFEYRTVFVPDSLSIDTFYTAYSGISPNYFQIDRAQWVATADNYEKTGQLPNGAPGKVLDGKTDTYWHTNHSQSPVTGYPHWLAFDMIRNVKVDRVVLTSRSDYFTADFTDFIIQGSNDGITWQDYGSFKLAEMIGPQTFTLAGTPEMRYLRIWQIRANGAPHSHLAEFSLFGSYSQ
jgi:hypothetical protein